MPIDPTYTATASATGGRTGRARSDDGRIDLPLAHPKALGGNGEGTNPEQLFAAAYAACFLSATKAAAREDKSLPRVPDDAEVTADVGIGRRPEGGFGIVVTLRAALPGLSDEEAETLLAAGDRTCPYSHALRGNVDVTIERAST